MSGCKMTADLNLRPLVHIPSVTLFLIWECMSEWSNSFLFTKTVFELLMFEAKAEGMTYWEISLTRNDNPALSWFILIIKNIILIENSLLTSFYLFFGLTQSLKKAKNKSTLISWTWGGNLDKHHSFLF